MSLGIAALLALTALAGGCASSHADLLQFLATTHSPTGCDEYVVMPPDGLTIVARPTDEFDNYRVRVGPDGMAALPLIGNVMFAGKTTDQIAAEVKQALLEYYEDVEVIVTVRNYRSQRYFVFGQVARKGSFAFTGNNTIVSALATASPTRLAMPQRITVVRGMRPMPDEKGVPVDQGGRIKNQTQRITIDLAAMVRNGEPANFRLANNDIIYVPPHPLAKIGLGLRQLLFPITPAIQTVASPENFADAADGRGPGTY
ncbi:MAG: polysaccharide biosynthesis/export family protein [Planctomycetota bacterium]